jgi:hypothetical protein
MKIRILLPLVALTLLPAGCSRPDKDEAAAAPEKAAETPSRVSHGTNGEVIVTLDAETQQVMGLQTAALGSVRTSPEVKGYGRVLDAAPLASLVADFTAAQAASDASKAELERSKVLASENNISERALQAAVATAARDEAQAASARLKLYGGWGEVLAARQDLPALIRSLGSLEKALVRVELPAGETLASLPAKARLLTLAGEEVEGECLGGGQAVDPLTQSPGFMFLVQSNSARLVPGAAVTGYLQVAGEAIPGVVVPRAAVLRHEGAGWVYVETGGTNFVRRRILLDQPGADGWFVTRGVAAGDHVVVTGAQTVFSEELNGSGFMSGGRD